MCSKEDVHHAIRFLFDGMDGTVIEKIDSKMRELPGLGWFDLFSRFVKRHNIRRAPASWMPRAEPQRNTAEVAINGGSCSASP